MKRVLSVLAALAALCAGAAQAATVSKSYSYFYIGGKSVAEIERQLQQRGPQINGGGQRHPGATRMEFNSRVGYRETKGRCALFDVKVTLRARVILPKWQQRGAGGDIRLIWDTLASDIRRHEDAHIAIGRRHAERLEQALKRVPAQANCTAAQREVRAVTDAALARHDAEQARFDADEASTFQDRFLRLLEKRTSRR